MQMRKSFIAVLLMSVVLGGTYLYLITGTVCDVPLSYRVGFIDNRFYITNEEALAAIADAEKVWEDSVQKELFMYDPKADFVINFVFDDRQAFAEAEIDFRERLDQTQTQSSEINETYETLIARYDALEHEYQEKVDSYEAQVAAYNEKVERYNDSGGAPEEVYEELQVEKDKLNSQVQTINLLTKQLNQLAGDINALGERGNRLIENYNHNVNRYNDTFGESHEFTQGDYQGTQINIYKFIDGIELRLVLAHELGHALSLDHVEDESAIMYHHLEKQPNTLRLTDADKNEYDRVCNHRIATRLQVLKEQFSL